MENEITIFVIFLERATVSHYSKFTQPLNMALTASTVSWAAVVPSLAVSVARSQRLRTSPFMGMAKTTKLSVRSQSKLVVVRATASTDTYDADTGATANLKEFLSDLKNVGRVRLIVNTGLGVLESVTTLGGLFYHTLPGKGEYANVIKSEENVDFHLLLSSVSGAKLITGKSMRGDFPTYTVRFLNAEKEVGASIFVMWKPGTMGDYDEGQADAYKALVNKYGEEVSFASTEYDI
ncbi:unnamed protein product [Closterium sp. Yama58-4]|nr:unnamed protein product [Closterium sp. Yama58-4]